MPVQIEEKFLWVGKQKIQYAKFKGLVELHLQYVANTVELEKRGRNLTEPQDFKNLVIDVCKWGGRQGDRIRVNIFQMISQRILRVVSKRQWLNWR